MTTTSYDPSGLFARETDSVGCIICPNTSAKCPPCSEGQECEQKAQTCDRCAEYVCVPSTTRSTLPIGGIVGGVVGGVLLIAIASGLYWYYRNIYLKNKNVSNDDDIMMQGKDLESVYSNKEYLDSPVTSEKFSSLGTSPVTRAPNSRQNKRVSSYDSFTKPKKSYPTKNKTPKELAAIQRRERQKNIALEANRNLNIQGFVEPANSRHSIATTVSTSNASNILPIAYIPGVTVRPTKNNTRSVFSMDSESVFSDLNTIENASIISESNENNENIGIAIRAQPRMLNVEKIEEEEEVEDYTEEDFDQTPKDQMLIINHEDVTDDSDVDSDMENITRATSFRRTKKSDSNSDSHPIDLEIPLNLDDRDNNTITSAGSFVLDVEIDPESPFSDPNQ